MSAADTPRVAAGRISVTRLYDVAYEIDLDRVEREGRASATRLRLSRARPKAISYARPPVDITLGDVSVPFVGRERTLQVKARVYDFGAVGLSYALAVEAMSWEAFVDLVNGTEALLESSTPWAQDLDRVRELIAPALTRTSEAGLDLDYVLATVHRLDPRLSAEEALRHVDPVPLLTGDAAPLSASARRDALRHTYSYYEDDLVVIGPTRALILEPGGETDVADILGVAHAQLLELRYYNQRLDQELPRMYDRVEQARSALGGLGRRRYASLAQSLHALHAEVTEVSERIENALVVTEDTYLAKVYDAALAQHRVPAWSVAVDRKLGIIKDTYTALYDEATSARAEYLEIAIVALIALEIVLLFLL